MSAGGGDIGVRVVASGASLVLPGPYLLNGAIAPAACPASGSPGLDLAEARAVSSSNLPLQQQQLNFREQADKGWTDRGGAFSTARRRTWASAQDVVVAAQQKIIRRQQLRNGTPAGARPSCLPLTPRHAEPIFRRFHRLHRRYDSFDSLIHIFLAA